MEIPGAAFRGCGNREVEIYFIEDEYCSGVENANVLNKEPCLIFVLFEIYRDNSKVSCMCILHALFADDIFIRFVSG
jgi:hypothetical protein